MDGAAHRQLADYDSHLPGRLFEDPAFQPGLDEAYAIQTAVAELRHARGENIAGYKIGCISETVQAQLGLSAPAFGYVFASEIRADGATLESAEFANLAIEGEFAARIRRDVTDTRRLLYNPEEFVSTVFPVIELHNYLFRRAKPSAEELIANNALHAGAVLPASEPPVDPSGRPRPVSVYRNGGLLGTASLTSGEFFSVFLVACHLEQHGRMLKAGDIVLTGSPLPLYPVVPGDTIAVTGRDVEVHCSIL